MLFFLTNIFLYSEKASPEAHKVTEVKKASAVEEDSRQKIAKERGNACQCAKSWSTKFVKFAFKLKDNYLLNVCMSNPQDECKK